MTLSLRDGVHPAFHLVPVSSHRKCSKQKAEIWHMYASLARSFIIGSSCLGVPFILPATFSHVMCKRQRSLKSHPVEVVGSAELSLLKTPYVKTLSDSLFHWHERTSMLIRQFFPAISLCAVLLSAWNHSMLQCIANGVVGAVICRLTGAVGEISMPIPLNTPTTAIIETHVLW